MPIKKVLGGILMVISMFLSLENIFSSKITGAAIGSDLESSVFAVLTLMFFVMGLIFMSNLEKRTSNWVKAAAIAGSVAVVGIPAYNSRNEKINKRIENVLEDEEKVRVVSPAVTMQGKFERTYRWDRILDEIEEKYGLPYGILKGLAMRESYGDPLRLNESNDGGAGLFMFQPRTAKHYGLKVYGNSDRSSADKDHGEDLRKLVEKYNYDYEKLAEIDERFDVRKSAEAAAKYLKEDFKRYGSWDKALSAYNQGKPAPNASETHHVKAVNAYTEYYNQRDRKDDKYYAKIDSVKKRQAEQNSKGVKLSNKRARR